MTDELKEIREDINKIDEQMLDLFVKRMEKIQAVANSKKNTACQFLIQNKRKESKNIMWHVLILLSLHLIM